MKMCAFHFLLRELYRSIMSRGCVEHTPSTCSLFTSLVVQFSLFILSMQCIHKRRCCCFSCVPVRMKWRYSHTSLAIHIPCFLVRIPQRVGYRCPADQDDSVRLTVCDPLFPHLIVCASLRTLRKRDAAMRKFKLLTAAHEVEGEAEVRWSSW